jgi:HxlR-like helix-turn-helix
VVEWWSILNLRDAFQGLTRFDQIQRDLEIAPNMLTRRLNALVDSKTGVEAEPVFVDRRSGHSITAPHCKSLPGLAADERARWRYALIKQDRSDRPRPPAAAKGAGSGAKAGRRL